MNQYIQFLFSINYLACLVDNLITVRKFSVDSEEFDISDKGSWLFGIIEHYRVGYGHGETNIIIPNFDNYTVSTNAILTGGAVSSYGLVTRNGKIKIYKSSSNTIVRHIRVVILFYISTEYTNVI